MKIYQQLLHFYRLCSNTRRRFSESTITVIVKSLLSPTPDMTKNNFYDIPHAPTYYFRLLCCAHQYKCCVLFALDSVESEAETELRYWRSVGMYCEDRGFLYTRVKFYHKFSSLPPSQFLTHSLLQIFLLPCPRKFSTLFLVKTSKLLRTYNLVTPSFPLPGSDSFLHDTRVQSSHVCDRNTEVSARFHSEARTARYFYAYQPSMSSVPTSSFADF